MTNRQRLILDCDHLWSEIIKLNYKGRCGLCGAIGQDPHHIARKKGQMRWLIPNGIWLCRKCHSYGHDHEHQMNIKIEEKIGLGMFVHLYNLALEVYQYKTCEIEDVKVSLKQELERIKT